MGKMRYGLCLGATALACAWSGVSTPAHAQGIPQSSIPMFDSISAMGKQMAASGIYFTLGYTEDITRMASGGVPGKIGWYPIGHASAGITLDLETIAGLSGSSLHVIFEERPGNAAPAGNDLGTNQNAGPVKYRLTQFYWEQGFDHDRIDIQVGRDEPTLEFAVSDISCITVMDIICAQPSTWYATTANNGYPSSEWGGRVNLAITPEIYAKAGVYDNNPTGSGFLDAGFDWNTARSTGVFIPVEVGYLTGFSSVQLPAKYDIGYWRDTSRFHFGDQAGNPTKNGRDSAYIQLQQTVWRPDMKTHQSLTLFAGAEFYDNSAAYRGQYYAGLYSRAPFGDLRPLDAFALVGTMLDINTSAVAVSPANAALSGTTPHAGAPWSRTWMGEVNYMVGLAPGLSATPYVGYIAQPFARGNPTATTKNVVTFGIELTVVFDQLFNFPVFVPH